MNPTYLLDTTRWIDLLRTNSQTIRRKLEAHSQHVVGLSVITLCELRFGVELRGKRHPHLRNRDEALLQQMIAPFNIFPFTVEVADMYGKLRVALEGSGHVIGALDLLIAAQAMTLQATLVTSNQKEFQKVPGLRVEDWR